MAEATPRYEAIADYLREVVDAADADQRLPSESDLCQRFDVSRMTARHAIQTLEAEGLVYRKRGLGTFKAPRRVHQLLGTSLSFTESMRQRGLTASSSLLEFGWIEPSANDREALGIDRGDGAIVLERIRFADGVPMALERAVISPACRDILDADVEAGSLHQAFERLGLRPARAHATVGARPATARERDLLGLPANGVVLTERRVIDDDSGTPLEHTETVYAAERYEFDAVLYRDQTEESP